MIDYHCHLLPELDDGPRDVDESLEMAAALVSFGFREVCCTPHCIKGHYEYSPVEVREAVRCLQNRLDYEGVALRLHSGMEYYLDGCFEGFVSNLIPLGESRLVLCEAPPQVHPGVVAAALELIVIHGYIPLIAHPERSEVVWKMLEEQKETGLKTQDARNEAPDEGRKTQDARAESQDPKDGSWWKHLFPSRKADAATPNAKFKIQNSKLAQASPEFPDPCLYQANLGAFTGFYGPVPQRRAYELLQRGVYSCLASDLHEARSATGLLEQAQEKLAFNPALQKLAAFKAPQGQGGACQMAFW